MRTHDFEMEIHIGALVDLQRIAGKLNGEGEGLLEMLVIVQDTLRGLHRETRDEDDQGEQEKQETEKNPEVFQQPTEIHGVGKANWRKLLGPLIDRSKKQFVVGILLQVVGELNRVEQLILNVGEETTDEQGGLFDRHQFPETQKVHQGDQEIAHKDQRTTKDKDQKEDESYPRGEPGKIFETVQQKIKQDPQGRSDQQSLEKTVDIELPCEALNFINQNLLGGHASKINKVQR